MNISYTYDGVDYIESGGTITEAHPSLVSLPDATYVLGLSRLHVQFRGTVNPSKLEMIISDGSKKAVTDNIPYTSVYDYVDRKWYSEVDTIIDTAGLTLEADSGQAGIEFIFYQGGTYVPYSVIADTGRFSASVCEYVTPSLSAFEVYRSNSSGGTTGDLEYGAYTITSNAAAMQAAKVNYPALLKNAVSTVITFTRDVDGVPTPYSNDISGSGDVFRSGGSPLQLGGEETFTVTATLTDGINTVTMSALLSANFAIFNCNAAKNSVGIGKYCDGTFTGLDVNMAAKFRHDVTFDSIPFILPNMMECLWKKASPGTSQSAATVTLTRNLTAGEPVLVIWREWENSSAPAGRLYTSIGWAGHNVGLMFVATSSTNRNGNRTIVIGPTGTYASNQLRIEACEYNGSTNNAYGVVLALFAFKREWLNFQNTWDSYTAP